MRSHEFIKEAFVGQASPVPKKKSSHTSFDQAAKKVSLIAKSLNKSKRRK